MAKRVQSKERLAKQAVMARKWREKQGPDYKMRKRVRAWKYQDLPPPGRPISEVCECCGDQPGKKALALDHCHASGIFRGWLCGNCNTGIGKFKDDPKRLQQAIDYLHRSILFN